MWSSCDMKQYSRTETRVRKNKQILPCIQIVLSLPFSCFQEVCRVLIRTGHFKSASFEWQISHFCLLFLPGKILQSISELLQLSQLVLCKRWRSFWTCLCPINIVQERRIFSCLGCVVPCNRKSLPGLGPLSNEGRVHVPEVIPTADAAHPNLRTRDCKVRAVTVRFLWLLLVFSGQNPLLWGRRQRGRNLHLFQA